MSELVGNGFGNFFVRKCGAESEVNSEKFHGSSVFKNKVGTLGFDKTVFSGGGVVQPRKIESSAFRNTGILFVSDCRMFKYSGHFYSFFRFLSLRERSRYSVCYVWSRKKRKRQSTDIS